MGAQLAGESRAEGSGIKEERAEGGAGPETGRQPPQVQETTTTRAKRSEKTGQPRQDQDGPPNHKEEYPQSKREYPQPEQEYPQPKQVYPQPEQEYPQPEQEYPQPMPVSRRHLRSRSIITDIQRMPTEAIYAEFDRLIQQVEGHLGQVAVDPPCMDVAARLQSCLQAHRQRTCNCFAAMEEYRHCVVRATQNRVDDMADMEPPMLPVVPPQVMPPPAVPPPNARGNRRWWKFWTWFR
ncbi:alpha/beta-gliadin A-IV [Drosophila santomea]|uniref:alpha/beta-gliadin A-IV n=1 Tax=Drosophila santomea TaxID=129105 RepID=UPI001953532A|nr:alpha/beta-gliadin A-IV [Drosophila santomea]